MKEEIKELSKHRLNRAREAFSEGDTLFEKEAFRGALSRFYYAAFYAARALLATKEMDSSKHSGVISLFHEHFVKTKLIDIEKAKALSRSFEKRQDSDYEDFVSVGRNEVSEIRREVEAFIAECDRVLGKLF